MAKIKVNDFAKELEAQAAELFEQSCYEGACVRSRFTLFTVPLRGSG